MNRIKCINRSAARAGARMGGGVRYERKISEKKKGVPYRRSTGGSGVLWGADVLIFFFG